MLASAAGATLAGGAVGALAGFSGRLDEPTLWFALAVIAWVAGTGFSLLQAEPSLAFLALQAWMALNVLNGAALGLIDGYTGIGPYDFTGGMGGGMKIAAMTEVGIVVGMLSARAVRGAARRRPGSIEGLPVALLDRCAAGLVVAGCVALLGYVTISGSGLGAVNVLSGSNVYGDLKREADGAAIGYLKVMTGLAGVGLMLATLRLTIDRRRWPRPFIVIVSSALMLVSTGGRSWLLVPAFGACLIWFQAGRSRWTGRPRRVVLMGGGVAFVVAALVGGLRGQASDKTIDPGAFVVKELRSGIFPTTAGLAESIPEREPFIAGRSFTDAGLLIVPRALWPDKPGNALDDVSEGFMPKDIGASFGLQGELYANFGYPGVLVGAGLFAALLEGCWLALVSSSRLSRILWFAALIPVLIQVFSRGYLVTMLAGELGVLLGAAACARMLHREAMPGPPARAGSSAGEAPIGAGSVEAISLGRPRQ